MGKKKSFIDKYNMALKDPTKSESISFIKKNFIGLDGNFDDNGVLKGFSAKDFSEKVGVDQPTFIFPKKQSTQFKGVYFNPLRGNNELSKGYIKTLGLDKVFDMPKNDLAVDEFFRYKINNPMKFNKPGVTHENITEQSITTKDFTKGTIESRGLSSSTTTPEPPHNEQTSTPVNTEVPQTTEEAAEKSKREAEEIEKNMRDKYLVSERKSASDVNEESHRQAEEIEENMRRIRESRNGIGPDNEKGYVSSAVGGTSKSWRKNHTNEENRFIDARRYYSKNLDIIKNQKSRLSEAKEKFLSEYDESMISDESMDKMKSAFEEAKTAHNQEVLEARRAGREIPKLNNKKIDSQIAQKVFGQSGEAELSAVGYMKTKTNAEGLIGRAQKRNDILGRYIDSAQEKGEQKIARGPKAGHSGWKGKAAIFGGVAMAALATVGVANLAMSGGRQSNSNLYNPYQAMY